jgi:hypothetical protein
MRWSQECIADGQRMQGTDGREPFKISNYALTRRTSLVLASDLPLATWKRVGEHLSMVVDSSAWWIGDWLIYGAARYPGRYRKALADTHLEYQTLKNYAWVARKFETPRRRVGLSFQHHVEVAALSEAEQDLWLDRAERLHWPRNELRAHVRASRTAPRSPADAYVAIGLTAARSQVDRWKAAASHAQKDLAEWIVDLLEKATT